MKIKINTASPQSTVHYYEGHIVKDTSEIPEEACLETFCFEVKDWGGDVEVCWLEEYPFDDKSDVEDKIIEQYIQQMQ